MSRSMADASAEYALDSHKRPWAAPRPMKFPSLEGCGVGCRELGRPHPEGYSLLPSQEGIF